MAHVSLSRPLPGMAGLLASYPVTAGPLGELADALLGRDDGLSRGERELIGAFVSTGNGCTYCAAMHGAVACAHLGPDAGLVDTVLEVEGTPSSSAAALDPRLRALLALAEEVRRGGDQVRAETVRAAREAGASDPEIHDTVLIAATFCMFNRYVDGLRTALPDDPSWYAIGARRLAERGYATPPPSSPVDVGSSQ
jgi:uncharacterized peroxidase-related enzyme